MGNFLLSLLKWYNCAMFKKIKEIHYKELFLYGFYLSYIGLTSLATLIDFLIESYDDALIDFISVVIASVSFWYF